MHKDKWHTHYEKHDGNNGTHYYDYSRFTDRNTGMAQEKHLSNRSAAETGC